ncbi:hypothetical protein BX666DRAFT_1858376 [Dichotomocladium elegans]|nr:hypothetical protein BX666DRAFT_1858376 [Dichotomocladium elegans]
MQDIQFNNYVKFDRFEAPDAESNKRKKATRACFHCQKAHLTCDDARPCQRCIKRGLAPTCADAVRKKAKYLQDQGSETDTTTTATTPPTTTAPTATTANATDTREYSRISRLNNNNNNNNNNNYSSSSNHRPTLPPASAATTRSTSNGGLGNAGTSSGFPSDLLQLSSNLSHQPADSVITPYITPSQPLPLFPMSTTAAFAPGANPLANDKTGNANGRRKQHTPETVYMNVKRPFNYAEGFHYLIEYVKEKMNRDDLMRISRSLALFRPSFLALIMNLTEEDLVFMEKCIQRTLLEYEKLISFSGTPTVVWRRTGEVCLVGKEFLLLTQWPRDTLLNKKTYIYELMDNRSAVEYWEKFSTHAFDNTDKSCMYSCILKTPHQKPVPCTFCFTIKRDIFDLPSVIVGNVSQE